MYKFIAELIFDPLGLPINALLEYVILAIIGEVAYRVAFEVSPGGRFGSEIHWAVRIPVYIVMWAIAYGVIAAVKWLVANWVIIVSVLGGVFVVGGITAIILLNRRKGKAKLNERNEAQRN